METLKSYLLTACLLGVLLSVTFVEETTAFPSENLYTSIIAVELAPAQSEQLLSLKLAATAATRIRDLHLRATELQRDEDQEVPAHGQKLGSSLWTALRTNGCLDLILQVPDGEELPIASSVALLEQCLSPENRDYLLAHRLEAVARSACRRSTKNPNQTHWRLGTRILEELFKFSEDTCRNVVTLGGLEAVLFECRKSDMETLRHCGCALANLSLYDGAECQEVMIKQKAPRDDNVKYSACLAIAALVAIEEIEASILKSGTLDLVEAFIRQHEPSDLAYGQSKVWLQRQVPHREARSSAAFHFCMEAGMRKQEGNWDLFREMKTIEPLKEEVASCPNTIAAQALPLSAEEDPRQLSQQVPLWSIEDVQEWLRQISFTEFAENFNENRVDGDLLLQLTDENLFLDIGMKNGIRRKRFTRELQNLKKTADYRSKDQTNLNAYLQAVGLEYSIYTYSMLNAGVDRDMLRLLSEEQLLLECGITNSIHRSRLIDTFKEKKGSLGNSFEEHLDKSLDVFISYRRSSGSQLASLLKVHLELRGFSVFLDVERLEAGQFDNDLLENIEQAKHFLLVLTPQALDRCIQDVERKDWVHREIVAALAAQSNIIPITDNFTWPDPEELPEDMRTISNFNGVMWIHDYQEACLDKLERFLRRRHHLRARSHSIVQTEQLSRAGSEELRADSDTPMD